MKRLLVAVDGSLRASMVLARAVELARPTGAKIRLFRAVPIQPEVPGDLFREFPPGGLEQVLTERARIELEGMLERQVPAEHRDGVAAAVGVAWWAICKAAREYDADLLVIGSHGYHGLDRVLGTTASKVVNHADRSVLVVREAGTNATHAP